MSKLIIFLLGLVLLFGCQTVSQLNELPLYRTLPRLTITIDARLRRFHRYILPHICLFSPQRLQARSCRRGWRGRWHPLQSHWPGKRKCLLSSSCHTDTWSANNLVSLSWLSWRRSILTLTFLLVPLSPWMVLPLLIILSPRYEYTQALIQWVWSTSNEILAKEESTSISVHACSRLGMG